MSQHRTLILGESKSGKTHLVGQILGRTRFDLGALQLKEMPNSLQMVDDVLDRLAQGLAASHTPAGVFRETEFKLLDNMDRAVELLWPDYAGEQITEIVMKRALKPDWAKRIQAADSWTLLIRLSGVIRNKTALEQTPIPVEVARQVDQTKHNQHLPSQLRFIELLQILQHCRYQDGTKVPPLLVMVTCVDELESFEHPRKALVEQLPLFVSYLEANWAPRHLAYWGLSSLGMHLSESDPNEDFANGGPQEHGFVVDSEGNRDSDLTRPFAELLANA